MLYCRSVTLELNCFTQLAIVHDGDRDVIFNVLCDGDRDHLGGEGFLRVQRAIVVHIKK